MLLQLKHKRMRRVENRKRGRRYQAQNKSMCKGKNAKIS